MIDSSDPKTSAPQHTGYRKRAISGAVVTGAGTLAKGVLQVLAIVWLARLLTLPFGIASVAAVLGVRLLAASMAGTNDLLFLATAGTGAYALTVACLLLNHVGRSFLEEVVLGAKALVGGSRSNTLATGHS